MLLISSLNFHVIVFSVTFSCFRGKSTTFGELKAVVSVKCFVCSFLLVLLHYVDKKKGSLMSVFVLIKLRMS